MITSLLEKLTLVGCKTRAKPYRAGKP